MKFMILASAVLRMLVGTYTQGTGSEGVYLYRFNQDNGSFEKLSVASAGNPSFVIWAKDGVHANAVSEFNDGEQGIYTLSVRPDGTVAIENAQAMPYSDCADPCNIIEVGNKLITSNYTGGTYSGFPIGADGLAGRMYRQFSPAHWLADNGFAGSTASAAHPHCVVASPDGKYLFATDLGSDAIYRFDIGGDYLNDPYVYFKSPLCAYRWEGSAHPGPRHMTFSPDGRFAYVICELGDVLAVFEYNDGSLEPVQEIKAYDGGGKGSADIHFSPDGRFLYTSHRLKEDGISIFAVNPKNGKVKKVGFERTLSHPRNFAITPNGKYLLCACRDSNVIDIYQINQKDGSLQRSGTITLLAPVCIAFHE